MGDGVTRQELRALVADILAIHVCPCCLDSMPERADTILRAHDMVVAAELVKAGKAPRDVGI